MVKFILLIGEKVVFLQLIKSAKNDIVAYIFGNVFLNCFDSSICAGFPFNGCACRNQSRPKRCRLVLFVLAD